MTITCNGTQIEPMGIEETVLWFGFLFSPEDGGVLFSGKTHFLRVHSVTCQKTVAFVITAL
jgi:hypothetical protein